MSTLVLKFGGTSVGTTDLITSAAKIIQKEYEDGHNVAVVVSAMSGATNGLIEHVNSIGQENEAEYDVVVSSGEQVTAGLMSLALNKLGIPARSWLGWQIPIITRGSHCSSRIIKIHKAKILNYLKKGGIPIITGFQGINSNFRITTIE